MRVVFAVPNQSHEIRQFDNLCIIQNTAIVRLMRIKLSQAVLPELLPRLVEEAVCLVSHISNQSHERVVNSIIFASSQSIAIVRLMRVKLS